MTHQRTPPPDRPEAALYEIRLEGRLDTHWAAWFDGLTVSHDGDGTTVISGGVADQAALHGVLRRVRDLGLPLISVLRLEPTDPSSPTRADDPALTGPDAVSHSHPPTEGDRIP